MTTSTLNDVRQIVQEARDGGLVPDLSGANLRGADLSGADLRDTNLRDADLYGADLSGANLCDADLSGANLRGANLYDTDLRDTNLYGANLSSATLCDANLSGADLRDTDLRGADLRGADLFGADLYGATLLSADLSGAGLFEANLYGANLHRVIGWDGLQIANLHPHPIHLNATPEGWSIRIGCWTGTPDELEALISQDEGWPESTGEEIIKNRALLTAAMVVIHTHIGAHPTAINDGVKAHAAAAARTHKEKK